MMLTDRQTYELTGYPSIDKPWLKYFTEDELKKELPKGTIYEEIYNRNINNQNATAINYYGNKISFKALFSETEKCARSLKKIGIGQGDCVTLCTAGVPEAIYLVLACSRIGAIANFINPVFSETQMIDRVNDTGSGWFFVLDSLYPHVESALLQSCVRNVVVIPATNSINPILSKLLYLRSKAREIVANRNHTKLEFFSWKHFVRSGSNYKGDIDVQYQVATPTVMVYSSGSTGASKGILLTNDGINATILHYNT